jgi:hypothetical protein
VTVIEATRSLIIKSFVATSCRCGEQLTKLTPIHILWRWSSTLAVLALNKDSCNSELKRKVKLDVVVIHARSTRGEALPGIAQTTLGNSEHIVVICSMLDRYRLLVDNDLNQTRNVSQTVKKGHGM